MKPYSGREQMVRNHDPRTPVDRRRSTCRKVMMNVHHTSQMFKDLINSYYHPIPTHP